MVNWPLALSIQKAPFCGLSDGQDGSAIFQRNAEGFGFSLGGEADFVAEGRGTEVQRRRAYEKFGGI